MKLKAVDYFHKKLHFKCSESAPESASGVSTPKHSSTKQICWFNPRRSSFIF